MSGQEATVVGPIAGHQSLRAQIVGSLQAAVVSGKLEPGVVYSVPSLAVQFGISATPVREAMLELSRDGLVEPVRNKGFRVTVMTDHQLDEITQLRALIEVPTVGAVAEVITPEQVEQLRELAVQNVEAAERGELTGFLETDKAFHLTMLSIAGNALIVETVNGLRMRTRLYGLPQLEREHRLGQAAEEHVEIVEALAGGDARLAESLMREHIGHVRDLWASADRA